MALVYIGWPDAIVAHDESVKHITANSPDDLADKLKAAAQKRAEMIALGLRLDELLPGPAGAWRTVRELKAKLSPATMPAPPLASSFTTDPTLARAYASKRAEEVIDLLSERIGSLSISGRLVDVETLDPDIFNANGQPRHRP